MTKMKFWMLSILFAMFLLTSCEKDEEAVNESLVLAEYLESPDSPYGKDYVNVDMPSIMTAEDVNTLNLTGQVYIIDIRAEADFNTGHIANAHNVTLAGLLDHLAGIDLAPYTKVAIVCYTGQTAGFATSILRLLGYEKAFSMKWGMCAWNEVFAGKWNTAISNGNAYASEFTATPTDKGAIGEMPVLSTGFETGQEILEARADAILTEGFTPATVTNQTVFGALSSYYIVNYWPADQYTNPGHIPGAMQYTQKESMKLATDLKTLPTDKPVAVYCYSGQTSAFLAAYLRMLGYDAKSVLFGTNAMIYDKMGQNGNMNGSMWSAAQIKGYDFEVK